MIHELFDPLAAAAARHVGEQIEPHPLYVDFAGAAGRKECELDAVAQLGDERLSPYAGVDDAFVDDEANSASVGALGGQYPDRPSEEVAGLGRRNIPVQCLGLGGDRAGDEALLVPAIRDDLAALALEHPVAGNLGVDLDAHLVPVEDWAGFCRVLREAAQLRQNEFSEGRIPWAEHRRLGSPEPRADRREGAAHRAAGALQLVRVGQFQAEQVESPNGMQLARPVGTESITRFNFSGSRASSLSAPMKSRRSTKPTSLGLAKRWAAFTAEEGPKSKWRATCRLVMTCRAR